jgi:dolichol-phosphate mannosyltransferase
MFYRVIYRITDVKIPLDTGDFRLMDAKVATVLRQMREHNRFIRGMTSWVGFKQTGGAKGSPPACADRPPPRSVPG